MINIKGLSVIFENKTILNNINLFINKGSTIVLFGKNGSGKSVLLKAIAGLISNYSGTIEINGHDIKLNDVRATMSYVFQKGGLFDSMNVFENVAFPLRRARKEEADISRAVYDSLERVGLTGNEGKLPSELSGGMQKRVGLARAICTSPDIILYDDPTAGLDPILSDSISDVIKEIKNTYKSTSFVVTHDIEVARKIADEIALLYNGGLVFSGSAPDFFSKNNPYARQFIDAALEGPIDVF